MDIVHCMELWTKILFMIQGLSMIVTGTLCDLLISTIRVTQNAAVRTLMTSRWNFVLAFGIMQSMAVLPFFFIRMTSYKFKPIIAFVSWSAFSSSLCLYMVVEALHETYDALTVAWHTNLQATVIVSYTFVTFYGCLEIAQVLLHAVLFLTKSRHYKIAGRSEAATIALSGVTDALQEPVVVTHVWK